MIAGHVMVFDANGEDSEIDEPTLIELTDWGLPLIEIALDIDGKRTYIKFRKSDLDREIKEAIAAGAQQVV